MLLWCYRASILSKVSNTMVLTRYKNSKGRNRSPDLTARATPVRQSSVLDLALTDRVSGVWYILNNFYDYNKVTGNIFTNIMQMVRSVTFLKAFILYCSMEGALRSTWKLLPEKLSKPHFAHTFFLDDNVTWCNNILLKHLLNTSYWFDIMSSSSVICAWSCNFHRLYSKHCNIVIEYSTAARG